VTTIAWRDGILACDKQGTWDNQKGRASFKAIVTDDKVYALTGSLTQGLRFIEDLQNEIDPKKRTKLKGTVVIEFDRITGNILLWESRRIPLPIEDKYWAEGSGGQFAVGAMGAGASAEEAVKIAAKHDCYTNGLQVWVSDKAAKRVLK
jgi:ATP-dependent HslUV protease subunit HslV